jgi:glucokinase
MLAGIDIGGTKTLVAVAGDDGRPLAEERLVSHADRGGDQLVERAAAALGRLAARHGAGPSGFAAAGVGVGGPIVRATGGLLDPPHLGWGDYPLRERLAERLGCPVAVENDCNAGALGEHRAGAGRGAASLVYFGVGTGIGGGVVLGGRVHEGASGNAGELGHLVVELGAPPDAHGWRGHLESHASGRGLARRAALLAARGEAPALLERCGTPDAITAADVAGLAVAGDGPARAVWRRGIEALAAGVASMLNALSPEVVVIGGGVPARAGAPYVDAVAAEARDLAFGPNASASAIVGAELGERSVLVGALVLAAEAGGVTEHDA